MPQRLVEITAPEDKGERVRDALEPLGLARFTERLAENGYTTFSIVTSVDNVEEILDTLREWMQESDDVFAHVVALEAVIPKPEEKEDDTEPSEKKASRVAREELHDDLEEASKLSRDYLLFCAFSSVVVAIGLVRDSPAVVIGGMLIAPLIGPNIALALATTLLDRSLAIRALRTNIAGVVTCAAVAALAAIVVSPSTSDSEIVARTSIGIGDLAIALAAGGAGALAYTTGISSMIVGVMVAVALLPPLVVTVLLGVNGRLDEAFRAGLLLTSNVVCINLAGIAVFLLKGVRPQAKDDHELSAKVAIAAIGVWLLLLAALFALILVAGNSSTQPS